MSFLTSKNIYATYKVHVIKTRYRDLKRIKLKVQLVDDKGLIDMPFNCEVRPDWFSGFYKFGEDPVKYTESQELLEVDSYKDWSL
jgi:hypothetical protein